MSVIDKLIQDEERERVQNAISMLPEKFRAVVRMKLDRYKEVDIARRLHVSVITVKRNYWLARRELALILNSA
jgi:DNA-directed RNA polymerase specialized sigma24 family protein